MSALSTVFCFAESGSLLQWNAVLQLASYVVGIVAVVYVARTYRDNSLREHAKWAVQLYEKFYEEQNYKGIRERLDSTANIDIVQAIVLEQDPDFTDYLNFFEMVTGLAKTKQLSRDDVLRLFQYYLQCLKRHDAVMSYINDPDNGYETLRAFLTEVQFQ